MLLHALVLLAALPTYGPLPAPSGSPSPVPADLRVPAAAGEALIVNSGSTNTAGYRLRVYADGTTALQQGDVPIRKHVSLTLVKRFFADLQTAGALDRLPPTFCMKSASFGSSTRIGYRGAMSPDVSCPSSSASLRALGIDATALAGAAGVSMMPRAMPPP